MTLIEQSKEFLSTYKYDDILIAFRKKNNIVSSKFILILAEINKVDNSIPPFCPTCGLEDKIRDGILNIRIFIKKNETQKIMEQNIKNQKYRFKKGNGSGLVIHFKGSTYTNANLTDAVAEELIKHNSANIKLFDITETKEVLKETEKVQEKKEVKKTKKSKK